MKRGLKSYVMCFDIQRGHILRDLILCYCSCVHAVCLVLGSRKNTPLSYDKVCLLLLLKENNNRVNMGKPMQNQEYGEGGETLCRVSYM